MLPTATLRAGQRDLATGRPEAAIEKASALLASRSMVRKAACLKALALHDLDRPEEALAILRELEGSQDHLPLFLQALIAYDLARWDDAQRAIGGARLLSHSDNFVVAGMERLIAARGGEDMAALAPLAGSPSRYNEFVGPRILLCLEEAIARSTIDLSSTPWAKLGEEPPAPQPRSWRTDLPFILFRVPILVLQRIFGRPSMPFAAERAYLRGDLAAARQIIGEAAARNGRNRDALRECLASLDFDLRDYDACLDHLPERGKDPDPGIEFLRGYASLQLKRWRRAEKAFEDAAPCPLAHYLRGLCHIALGERPQARRAFALETRRNDIEIAERILIAGRILGVFQGAGYAP